MFREYAALNCIYPVATPLLQTPYSLLPYSLCNKIYKENNGVRRGWGGVNCPTCIPQLGGAHSHHNIWKPAYIVQCIIEIQITLPLLRICLSTCVMLILRLIMVQAFAFLKNQRFTVKGTYASAESYSMWKCYLSLAIH